ncbi:hypothetical protein AB4211_08610 [Vibrio lentus]
MKSNIVFFIAGILGVLFGGVVLGYFLDNLMMGNLNLMECLLAYAPLISAVMPLCVVLLTGYLINTKLENVKSRLQLDHSIIEKRAETYALVKDDLNDIYSYIRRRGNWKEHTPEIIIGHKRTLDKAFYSTKPYWSNGAFSAYESFMKVCFKTNRGHGLDAGIIAEVNNYKNLDHWNDCFNDCFESGYDKAKLDEANKSLMEAFSKDFGIN